MTKTGLLKLYITESDEEHTLLGILYVTRTTIHDNQISVNKSFDMYGLNVWMLLR